jgi:hypothetical protein
MKIAVMDADGRGSGHLGRWVGHARGIAHGRKHWGVGWGVRRKTLSRECTR